MSTTSITLNGFPLIGTSARGGRFKVLELDGWFRSTIRRDRAGKAQQDGAWATSGNVDARAITIRGIATYSDTEAAKADARQLVACASRSLVPLTVIDALGPLTAQVEVDELNVPPVHDRMLTYTALVTAVDPLLYGPEEFAQTTLAGASGGAGLTYPLAYPLDYGLPPGVVEGAVRCENDGTATYWPLLRIDGPVPNPTIYCPETGDRIKYAGTVPAGQHLDIDCANRRVTLGDNATSMRHKVTASGSWLAIPPGGASVAWSADSSNPTATLSVRSYEGAWS